MSKGFRSLRFKMWSRSWMRLLEICGIRMNCFQGWRMLLGSSYWKSNMRRIKCLSRSRHLKLRRNRRSGCRFWLISSSEKLVLLSQMNWSRWLRGLILFTLNLLLSTKWKSRWLVLTSKHRCWIIRMMCARSWISSLRSWGSNCSPHKKDTVS